MDVAPLDGLVAKQAITEVLYRYCRGLDRMDRDMALSVWHPDGTADYGSMFDGTGAGFVDWVWKQHAGFDRHSHQITNILIDVTAADRAASEAYVTVALRMKPSVDKVIDIIGRGRYIDRWSRRDGTWAIDHRLYVHDMQTMHELSATQADDSASAARRGPDDPSYGILTR
ncbi:MAG TPA: nuclear transport factor 2 family protein [Acidimicrobiales bacterium]|jgi:hypothetical protein|nr:nuclear transport factor 2 family protein [Acidimicrobiales bacterium]